MLFFFKDTLIVVNISVIASCYINSLVIVHPIKAHNLYSRIYFLPMLATIVKALSSFFAFILAKSLQYSLILIKKWAVM